MKPLFKYAGGKRNEIQFIEPYLPLKYDKYIEPFMGGGALFFHLEPTKAIISENSIDVRNFYNTIKNDSRELLREILNLSEKYPTEYQDRSDLYYNFRESEPTTNMEKAIRFYVLRQLSFSGMIRFNKKGDFNVPFGHYDKLLPITRHFEALNRIFENTIILDDAFKALELATENDFVFLDPPYTRTFVEYHIDGQFGNKEHIKLANWFCNTKSKAMIVLNSDDFTLNLYGDYIKTKYGKKYAIEFMGRTKESTNAEHFIAINYKQRQEGLF